MSVADVIAIDGPAASGKSTLAKKLAEYLQYLFFDTGVMYRAVTWMALKVGAKIEDESAITALAEEIQIDVQPPSKADGRLNDVYVDDIDVTWEIRQPDVESNVSIVSAYAGVRLAMTEQQRRIGNRKFVVMVGRDIGTIVMPDAGLKIYLDASVEERAKRRYIECVERGDDVEYAEILKSMQERDRIDSTRQIAPLKPADDAFVIQSDGMDADQVFDKIVDLLDVEKP
jgi:cytidylate kinase